MSKRKKKKRRGRTAKRADMPEMRLVRASSGIIRPMSPHERRMQELGERFLPPPWLPGADRMYSYLTRQMRMDVASRIKAKEAWQLAREVWIKPYAETVP